jgi:hypothetical protein
MSSVRSAVFTFMKSILHTCAVLRKLRWRDRPSGLPIAPVNGFPLGGVAVSSHRTRGKSPLQIEVIGAVAAAAMRARMTGNLRITRARLSCNAL